MQNCHLTRKAQPPFNLFERLPSYPLQEDFELFDIWATHISKHITVNGKYLSFYEREVYRLLLQEHLENSLVNICGGIKRLIANMADRDMEYSIYSNDKSYH